MKQTTSHILMIRPHNFGYNVQTAESNDYQQKPADDAQQRVKQKAMEEFDAMVDLLRSQKIQVHVVEDTDTPLKPDAVFPNNWISMHENGEVFLYPMKNKNRAAERRHDIVEELAQKFEVKALRDLSAAEAEGIALEGTGSMIFDHVHCKAYACVSPRTDKVLFERYCDGIGYKPVLFHSYKRNGQPQYHTNVVMCIGSGFVVICLESISSAEERKMVKANIENDGLEIIEISRAQLEESFAGNMLQVENADGKQFLVMSARARASLTMEQLQQIEKYSAILAPDIDTIETVGGGSARCMMAEIFLPLKN